MLKAHGVSTKCGFVGVTDGLLPIKIACEQKTNKGAVTGDK